MARPSAVLALACLLPLAGGPGPARADTLNLEQALERALRQATDLQLAELEVRTAQARLIDARRPSPFNPELELSSGTRSTAGQPVDLGAELSQELEVAGQARHRRAAATARVASRQSAREHLRAQVARDTRVAFARALAARDRGSLADEAVELAGRLDEAAARRFEAGAITVLEKNLARVRAGEARRAQLAARRQASETLAELKALLSWPPGQELRVAGSLQPDAQPPLRREALRPGLAERRKDLSALRLGEEAAAAELRLARSEGRPNLRLGLGWERDGGDQDLRVAVGIALPIFQRNQGERAASQAAREGASLRRAAAELAVAQDFERAWERCLIASEDHAVFDEEVLQQVEENLELLQESFEAGKVSLLQLLPLQAELVQLREGHVDALAELAVARAELDLVAGLASPVSASPVRASPVSPSPAAASPAGHDHGDHR